MRVASPKFGHNEEDEKHSRGQRAIVSWAVRKMRWADVAVTTNETTYALAEKDIRAERGKRLCITGRVNEIHKRSFGAHDGGVSYVVYDGLIEPPTVRNGEVVADDIFSFVVVKSSGKIVQRDDARLCGVVVDRFDFNDSTGGFTKAIDVVGMFDLPENH